MRIFIDASYYAYHFGYYADNPNPYSFIEQVNGPNVFIAMDSKINIRKNTFPWYKANRKEPESCIQPLSFEGNNWEWEPCGQCRGCVGAKYKDRVNTILDGLYERYSNQILCTPGYEADDVIAENVMPNDTCYVNDKDYLTIPTRARLCTLKHETVTVDRFKSKWPIKRGNGALAFQLLMGDPTDNIPRRLKRDKVSAERIFSSSNPLEAAIEYVGDEAAIESLSVLVLPTPLMSCETDILDCVLRRYKV